MQRRPFATWQSWATTAPARPSSSPRCCSRPERRPASGTPRRWHGSRPTSTRKPLRAGTPSPPRPPGYEWQWQRKVNFVDTPGLRQLPERNRRVAAGHRRGAGRRRRRGGCGSADRDASGPLAGDERPREFVVVNRLDREQRQLCEHALEDLHGAFGRTRSGAVALRRRKGVPRGHRPWCPTGLLATTAATGRGEAVAIPESIARRPGDAREALVELVAEADDELMSRFFDEGTLKRRRTRRPVCVRRCETGAVVPVFCASGSREHRQPSAARGHSRSYTPIACRRVRSRPSRRSSGNVVTSVGRRERPDSRVRLEDGGRSVRRPHHLLQGLWRDREERRQRDNLTRSSTERLAHLSIPFGKTLQPITELQAGDIGAVAKLKETLTGDTLGDRPQLVYPPVKFPEPSLPSPSKRSRATTRTG